MAKKFSLSHARPAVKALWSKIKKKKTKKEDEESGLVKTKRKPTKKFHLFMNLPPEIRLMIWKYALEPVNLGICIPHMTRRSCRLTPGPGRFDCITQKCYPLVPAMMMTCHESRVFALQHYTQQTISWDWNDWGGSLPQYPNTIRYYLDNETAKFIAEGILQGTETSTIVQYYRRPSKFLFWHEPLDFLLDNFFDKTYYQEYLISCCFGIVDGRQHL